MSMIGKTARTLQKLTDAWLKDLGLLALRAAFGASLAFGHGFEKLTTYHEKAASWANPIGLGSANSLALMIFAEFFCSLAVIAGFATRLAAIPPLFGMGVAFFVVHGHSYAKGGEMAFLYLCAFLTLLLAGPGRFSVDGFLARRLK